MKLTCDSCSAKYSIADDRVAGKLFKIRCKKCSHVIIVRGTAVAAAPEPPPPVSGEWHAVVNGEQLGPFDRAELVRRREAGELDDDTYVWREGMTDWVALGTVDELTAQPPAIATVEVSDAMRLRNERNETSVLFTLGNLARLASQPAKAAPAVAGATSGAVEEGSGLIDIRALASSWAQPAATAKPVGSTAGSLDDLPAYAPINIADPIVLVPTNHRRGVDRRLLVALVAMLTMIATLATILVIVLTRDGGTAQAAVAPAPAVVTVPVIVEPPPPPPQVMLQPSTPTPPPIASTPATPKIRTHAPARIAKVATLRDPPKDEGCSEVSCMVNDNAGNCCDQFSARKPARPLTVKTGDLPENLDRAALGNGIATIKAQNCGASSPAKGDVSVSVKVTPDGTVSGVTIKSTPDQALAACVVAEAKRGTFAKTKRGGSFSYLWRF